MSNATTASQTLCLTNPWAPERIASRPFRSTTICFQVRRECPSESTFPPCLKLPLLDPELRRRLRIVAAHPGDEPLRVLAADEHLERVAEREVRWESVEDNGVRRSRERPNPFLAMASVRVILISWPSFSDNVC